jgi:hypothetical protein
MMRVIRQPTGVELTHDEPFEARVRRLSVVSVVALGVITVLAIRDGAPVGVVLALVAGWILMPSLLRLSLRQPVLRYALAIPATAVTVALGVFCMAALPSDASVAGWWVITASIALGAVMGMWLWFRWMPVPESLEDPFSPRRLTLVAVHIAGVLVGIVLVIT